MRNCDINDIIHICLFIIVFGSGCYIGHMATSEGIKTNIESYCAQKSDTNQYFECKKLLIEGE